MTIVTFVGPSGAVIDERRVRCVPSVGEVVALDGALYMAALVKHMLCGDDHAIAVTLSPVPVAAHAIGPAHDVEGTDKV